MSMDWGSIDEQERNDWVDAAVLIPIYSDGGEQHLILTKRTEVVLHHKGQICFPGGARDPGDVSLWETALRECQEEIGLDPKHVIKVRELERQYTPTGFRVTPFVGEVKSPLIFTPNPNEIAEIFSVPFSHFQNPENVKILRKEWEGRVFLDPHILYGQHEIWGMTGRVLCEFFGINPE